MIRWPLTRTEAERLIDLLEKQDPAHAGKWVAELAQELRELTGTASDEADEKRRSIDVIWRLLRKELGGQWTVVET